MYFMTGAERLFTFKRKDMMNIKKQRDPNIINATWYAIRGHFLCWN